MKLIKCIFWLESRRIRTYLIILAITLIGTTLLFGINNDIDITTMDLTIKSDNSQVTNLLQADQVIQLLPLWMILCASSIVGFIIAIILPVRSDQEWKGGQFQMLRLSRWNSWQILACRALVYGGIIWVFYTVLSLLTVLGVHVQKINLPGLSIDILIGIQIIALSLIPVFIALGIMIDSLRTAYYQKGLKWVHTSIQFFAWIMLLGFLMDMHERFAGAYLPKIQFQSLSAIEQVSGKAIQLFWEPMFISWALAAVLVIVSGQILKEVEA